MIKLCNTQECRMHVLMGILFVLAIIGLSWESSIQTNYSQTHVDVSSCPMVH